MRRRDLLTGALGFTCAAVADLPDPEDSAMSGLARSASIPRSWPGTQ